MMTRIPPTPLLLGLAGLVPFVWGALTMLVPALGAQGVSLLGPRFVGPYIQLSYGSVILAFMGGTLCGFATRAEGAVAPSAYMLSVVPALWAFFFVGGGPVSAATYLAIGFAGLIGLDWMFWRQGLAPPWWMPLSLGLMAVVILSLLPVIA